MKITKSKVKTLLFAIAMAFTITSCEEDKPLQNDALGPPVEFNAMMQSFVDATGRKTPEHMKKGEWVYYRNFAKLYTGVYQQQGYTTAEVLELGDETETIEDLTVPLRKINAVVTHYLPVQNPEETPQIDPSTPQKEWICKFAKSPYYIYIGECDLPVEQNFWAFYGLSIPTEPIFFSFAKYNMKRKLPKKMIDEGRCYGLANCEYDATVMEYDLIFQYPDGSRERRHYVTGFSGDLPYLASNFATCFSTLITIEGKKHPAELCKELVDFRPEAE